MSLLNKAIWFGMVVVLGMLFLFQKHWLKILLFSIIFVSLLITTAPDFTWANQDLDLFDFMFTTTYLNVGHAAGFPLYTMLGWLVTRIPGSDVWNLAFFLSVIPTLITCGLIFWIVHRKVVNTWAPYLAALAFAGSQVVFSQAIIPELYSLVTMFMVLSYMLLEKKYSGWGMLALGMGCAVHYLAVIMIPIVMWRYQLWKVWKWGTLRPFLMLAPGALMYLYIPLANHWPHMSLGPTSWDNVTNYLLYHGAMIFNLPVWLLPQRLAESIMIITASLGIALIFVALGLGQRENRTLLWLTLPGVIYYCTTLGAVAYAHMVPAFAFGAIAGGLALDRLPQRVNLKKLVPAAVGCSILLLGLNTWFYDIGRTLDPAPTGAREFLSALDQVEDGSILVCWSAVTFAGVYYYNEQEGRNIVPIHPVFISPDRAYPYELTRVPYLDYTQTGNAPIPSPSGDWLADYNAWALAHTEQFAENNPDYTIYAVLSDLEDRTRRNIQLVCVSDN